MAKKGNQLPGLRQALKVVDQLGAQMHGESRADYRVALSASSAGQANLSKQTRALTRDLLAGQLRQTTGLNKLAKQAAADQRNLAAKQGQVTNRYGSALGQQVSQSYAVARAGAKGNTALAKGAAQAGKATLGVAQTVGGIAAAGVQAQEAAAKYSLNQALQQRAIIDNQTLASLTGSLYETALQYNMQMEMYERQRRDAIKQMKMEQRFADKREGEAMAAQIGQLMTQGADISMAASEAYGAYLQSEAGIAAQKEGQPVPVGTLIESYNATMGYTGAEPEAQMFAATLRGIAQGRMPLDAYANAVTSLYGGLPGFEKYGKTVVEAGVANMRAQTVGQFANTLANVPEAKSWFDQLAGGGGGYSLFPTGREFPGSWNEYASQLSEATQATGGNPIGAAWYMTSNWLGSMFS